MAASSSSVRESDLYGPVKAYLEGNGYDVKAEVHGCDVVAIRDGELLVVELKLGITMPLLVQAANRQKFADGVYVAVPQPKTRLTSKRWVGVCALLKRLELGLLLVRPNARVNPQVEVLFHPLPFAAKRSARTKQAIIREASARSGDYNTGGSTRQKLVTSYRERAIHIACQLERHGEMSPRDLRAKGTGDNTTAILSHNYYGWFERVDRGIYRLTARGRTDLQQFETLANYFRAAISESYEGSGEGETVTRVP